MDKRKTCLVLVMSIITVVYVIVHIFIDTLGVVCGGGRDDLFDVGSGNTINNIIMIHADKYKYPLDARGKYMGITNACGADLLRTILTYRDKAMNHFANGLSRADIEHGVKMYKTHTPGAEVNTWPYEYYNDMRFCYAYMKFKTMQRYPEVYNLVDRAFAQPDANIKRILDLNRPIRAVLLGGGPGFEAVALRDVLHKNEVSVVNIDGSDVLGSVSNVFGAEFKHIQFDDIDGIMDTCNKVDIIIMSFVFKYFKSNLGMLKNILDQNTNCVLLVNHNTAHEGGVDELMKILSPLYTIKYVAYKKDTRQFMIFKKNKRTDTKYITPIFTNVPYAPGS